MMVMMLVLWLFIVAGEATKITDEDYYSLPRLFELDDYEQCVALHGTFCLGTFELTSKRYNPLLDIIQELSKDSHNFYRTHIHRGYCVNKTCSYIDGDSLSHVFEECVSNITTTLYGLNAELLRLDYCKDNNGSPQKNRIDTAEIVFACIVGLMLLANTVGTMYDLLRRQDIKPNIYLMTWSMRANWNRLTATYENGDPRLCDLDPVNGIKTLSLLLVLLAHSIMGYYMIYLFNPRFLELANLHPLAAYVNNGTTIVQTFIVLSSFLMAYNVMLTIERDPGKKINLAFLWKIFVHRFVRITPVSLFVVGFSATWWRYIGDGPLWPTLVGGESDICRAKWWSHALHINNFVMADDKCLIQTWFLAVDMQLYLLSSIILVCLVRWPNLALKIIGGLFGLNLVVNFAISYYWDLKTILFIAHPELIRASYKGDPSFKWFYAMPWSSAPAAFLGLLLAFGYHLMRKSDYKLHTNTLFRVLYRCSVPGMFVWIVCGYFVADAKSRLVISLYTTVYRPVFSALVTIAILGFISKIDRLWWQFLSWRGFQILGRMSLSILMIHWTYIITLLAVRPNLAHMSVLDTGGIWLSTIFLTYVSAVPLYLLIEVPMQKFFLALFS